MVTEKILVVGACGQIGVELTLQLRKMYGGANVIASDLREEHPMLKDTGPYIPMDIMNKETFHVLVLRYNITQVYLLAAILSATGEKNPPLAWNLNMQSLLNVLEVAKEEKLHKIYWPSSIAVFGPNSPKQQTPQHTIMEPTTVYGVSKLAGERWCEYYHHRYGVDVRSLRYPGLISYKSAPGGGTTDYAIEIYQDALREGKYECFLKEDTYLPMMYMPDAIRATIELMEADANRISVRSSYNLSAMSFSPKEIGEAIRKHLPAFAISYAPDFRQKIADSWPSSIDDGAAREDWGWAPGYDLERMTVDMLKNIGGSTSGA
ncbi:NAD-dependent epimerase/dehydratase family protein [Dinghuibacter silviterrae]|uniref:Nucleoside-diphosphate-sugar epimerase n=1 Tax=Dinghuibacter silviterrae TaxID=1539049 RepID=A0A4R8DTH9_9BACT|nr:NAD-dependent epimerase/dehydratase family protein [Dinghuibacter silviterrae]TDX00735.1 nucleoside-diphosphate-sugar epimerase [Dinghuibacter silviterrae]